MPLRYTRYQRETARGRDMTHIKDIMYTIIKVFLIPENAKGQPIRVIRSDHNFPEY